MEPCKIRTTTQPLPYARGLEGKEISSPSSRGTKMSLTSPLIDQALSQACAFHSPFLVILSVIEIFLNYQAIFACAERCTF
jgi:hypothetical protein